MLSVVMNLWVLGGSSQLRVDESTIFGFSRAIKSDATREKCILFRLCFKLKYKKFSFNFSIVRKSLTKIINFELR